VSISQRARALHAAQPDLPAAQIAAEIGCSVTLVHAALSRGGRRGRPPDLVTRVAKLRAELAEAERELAAARRASPAG
jgi:DNA-directed RNA polymerase specialized sigma24 family protein